MYQISPLDCYSILWVSVYITYISVRRLMMSLTFSSMPILMKEPVMVSKSLMMSRIYQPLINSIRSPQQTSRFREFLKYFTNSWKDTEQGNFILALRDKIVVLTWMCLIFYVLKNDSSDDGATAEDERENTHHCHDHVKPHTGITVSCVK